MSFTLFPKQNWGERMIFHLTKTYTLTIAVGLFYDGLIILSVGQTVYNNKESSETGSLL